MRAHPLPKTLAAAAVAAVLLAGCSREPEPDRLASARAHLAKNNTRAAVIELKNALQAKPDSAEARLLLGQTLLAGGDAGTAIVELRKAEDLKADPQRVTPSLARALLAAGQDRKLVDSYAQTTLADPAAQADLQTTLAAAYGRLNRNDAMEAAVAAALKAVPDHAGARLLQARILAEKSDLAGARALVDAVTDRNPADADAWMLLAELRLRADGRDRDGALAALRKAVAARNDAMRAHEAIVALLLQSRDIDGAAAHVAALTKTLPDLPGTKLLQAQVAFQRGDFAGTRALTQPLLQLAPNDPTLLQLAGAAEYQLRAWGPAETLLAQALRNAPALPLARELLARVQLRGGRPDKAMETLAPALAESDPAPQALMSAGEAQLMLGDNARAESLFARAAKSRPGDARARTALALSQLRKGDGSAAVAELERVAGSDNSGDGADKALIAAYLSRNDVPRALKAIDALERKQPDQPLAPQLRGRVQLLRGDAVAARASFERALAADAGYFPAVASLSALDMADKKPDAARQRLEALLRTQPGNQRAALALANIMARSGATPAQVLAQLDAAIKLDPNDTAARLELVSYQLGSGNAKGAAAAAQQALTAQPNSAALVGALGQAQLRAGDMQQAVTTFTRLAALQPKSPLAPLGMAEAQNGLKDYAAAERHLRRALELSPKLLPAQRGLVMLLVADHRYDDALAVARQAQAQRPGDSAGIVLEGDIETERRNWDAATAAYRRALQRDRSSLAAIKLHSVLAKAGRNDEAERFAAGWRKDSPNDVGFTYHLGDAALAGNDWPRAEVLYRDVLRVQPDHALALNNVAWLMLKQDKPGALQLAQQATSLQPQQPALRDTLALALASSKQLPQALQMQKETVELSPGDPNLRLTLARLYLQSGDKATARNELEKLTKLGKRFRDQDEVSRLLATI